MGSESFFDFFFKRINATYDLFFRIIEICRNEGFEFIEQNPISFLKNNEVIFEKAVNLKEALNSISKHKGGGLYFKKEHIGFYLRIFPEGKFRRIKGKNIEPLLGHISFFFGDLVFYPTENNDGSDEKYEEIGIGTINILLPLFKTIYYYLDPICGIFYTDDSIFESKFTEDNVLNLDIKHIFPMNIFGKEVVKKIGLSRLLMSNVYKIEELDDNGIVFWVFPNPLIYDMRKMVELEEYLFT